MRIEHTLGIYTEDYETMIKWYSLAHKGKHPSKADEALFNKINVYYEDLKKAEEEGYYDNDEE